MNNSRRNFLKIAAVTAAGVGASAAGAGAFYQPHIDHEQPSPDKLSAKRWGMVVDTRKLNTPEDFKPLEDACHNMYNVPKIKGKQEVKWIWHDNYHAVFPHKFPQYEAHQIEDKPYLLLCNHCEEPPCVRVCPTKATYKRDDGIVIMDYHRCIGCRFCMAGCPYGARSFNFMDPRPHINKMFMNREYPTRQKGVVEKCNFCAKRLAYGQMPACVEASNGALIFGDLEDPESEIRKVLAENYTVRRKPDLGTNPSVFYII